jgi:hypothetical protein
MLAAMDLGDLLERLWIDYAAITPQAGAIHRLLREAGETIVNDHIALRTFAGERLGLERLAAPFVAAGYTPAGAYSFADKKLDARHYEPPTPGLPRLFISELRLGDCSPALRATVEALIAQLPADYVPLARLGRPWSVAHAAVDQLRRESEYAAWLAAHGLRANHFTVSVDALATIPTIEAMVAFLQAHGFALNHAGGVIKGSPAVLLEQCSTLADAVDVAFSDGTHRVPGCYYEFARRHPGPDGRLFSGFIEGSADKIFESTDRAR